MAFQIDPSEKTALDKVEGLGFGYGEKEVIIVAQDGESLSAITYFATKIDDDLKPYSWYVNHVLIGAREASLPPAYINSKITALDPIEDSDRERDAKQRAIHY